MPLNTLLPGVTGSSLDRRGMDGGYILHQKTSGINQLASPRTQLRQLDSGMLPPHHQITESEEEEGVLENGRDIREHVVNDLNNKRGDEC